MDIVDNELMMMVLWFSYHFKCSELSAAETAGGIIDE